MSAVDRAARAGARICAGLAAAVAVAVVVAGASSARAETYALLPAGGDAFRPVLQEIDRQARKALQASGVDVQPEEVTEKALLDLQASGMMCDTGAEDCALRFGLAAGVDVVVAQSVSVAGNRLLLRSSALAMASDVRPRRIYGELVLPVHDNPAAVTSNVMRAIGKIAVPTPAPVIVHLEPKGALVLVDNAASGLDDGRLWLVRGSHHVDVRAPGYAPLSIELVVNDEEVGDVRWTLRKDAVPVVAVAPAPLTAAPMLPGLIVVGAGAAVVLLGAGTALASEIALASSMPKGERPTVTAVGRAGLVVAAVGAAAAAGGGAWMALE